ncbi:MAG: hypothetical protein Q9164_006008 [Protoblastenia rupestris]
MEQQVLDLLASTLDPSGPIRSNAERRLEQLYTNDAFPMSLISIASHKSIPLEHRQAALLSLKKLVLKTWSPSIEEYEGPNQTSDTVKDQVRQSILSIATAVDEPKKIIGAASYVVSKIASADFPEQWPTLLPTLLALVPQANDAQLHGVLVVLSDLVDDGFDEEQFAGSAAELVKCIYDVAVNGQKKLMTRSLAVSIFRSCLDTMEAVMQTNPDSVQQFMQSSSDVWVPFFIETVKAPLPSMPVEGEEPGSPGIGGWRGVIALKTQAVKALDKIHTLFPHLLGPRTIELFSAIWEALQAHLTPYHILYTGEDQKEGQLEDSDRLPYSLDLLVMEELDYTQTLLNTPTIKQAFDAQLAAPDVTNGAHSANWMTQVLALSVGYAHISAEDANMWEFDVNTFLAEEAAETAQYSARNACAGVVTKLCSYNWPVLESLLSFTKATFEETSPNSKAREAVLYVVKQAVEEMSAYERVVNPELLKTYLEYARLAMQDNDNDMLRGRGYITAGVLVTAPGKPLAELVPDAARQAIKVIETDGSEIVQVSGMKALQQYLKDLPKQLAQEYQIQTVAAISGFLSSRDLSEISEGEDLLATLVETLRDAIYTDPTLCLEHPAIDVLFTLASYGAKSWHTTDIVNEAFESAVSTMSSRGSEAYAQLCSKVLPSLTGALDVGDMTQENSLSDMAVTLMSVLAEYGSEPLPAGFVATIVPKLYRLIFLDLEFSVHQSATLTMKHILSHDAAQLFDWTDPETGKGGLEIILLVIDRLLGPSVQDSSAAEVGGLAMELVEKAGAERLGPYLMQLLQVVAIRLSTAERADFIQNLVLVFARLALTNAKEVLDFLAQVQVEGVEGGTGLEVVMRKWLENSINFSGYDAIRQNIIALTNIYKLHDDRLASIQTKGDLLIDSQSRIKTRSQAKKQPDQYSIIPVPLKLAKVLIQELVTTPNNAGMGLRKHSITQTHGSDDDEWEDEPAILDLGAQGTRQDLMGFMDEMNQWNLHQTDDETQQYLVHFFNDVANEPYFQEMYHALTDAEREKLMRMNDGRRHSVASG